MKPVEIFCDMSLEIICCDCGMLFEVSLKSEWKEYACPYCEKHFMAKNLIQALWLEEGESGVSALA